MSGTPANSARCRPRVRKLGTRAPTGPVQLEVKFAGAMLAGGRSGRGASSVRPRHYLPTTESRRPARADSAAVPGPTLRRTERLSSPPPTLGE